MKKVSLLIIMILVSVGLTRAQKNLGAGLAYGSEVEELGVFIEGELFVNNNISLSPGLIWYLVDNGPNVRRNYWEANFNFNYYFFEEWSVKFYALAGLNFSTVSFKPDGLTRQSDTKFGVNLGAGANWDINSIVMPFSEFKVVISDFDQAVLKVGIKYHLK